QFSGGTVAGVFDVANVAPTLVYNQVVGFTTAHDSVNINTTAIPTAYTDTGAPVAPLDPTTVSNFTGASQVLTGTHANYIDITTPGNFTGDTVQGAFNSAIGA